MIITIDGPAGAGKSTIAKRLAKELKITYLDTGAMYRAVTLKALQQGIDTRDEDALAELAAATRVRVLPSADGVRVMLDDADVTAAIRTEEVTRHSSIVAGKPKVRATIVDWQRRIGREQSIVIEGRDIGTVVFPDAEVKFFMDADLKERVRRRARELEEAGHTVDREALTEDLRERDRRDQERSVGPLVKAEDAVAINTTAYTIDEVVTHMLEEIRRRTPQTE
ncbi:MAG: (d)CMP kinase [Candidatus Omnitrophica bacterium]|nr:(d)CMP kinase [Candidatus Omnitrophota bacterium]MCB9721181.1 (d)CMP kinase [Candidatus Omnitrophota bacterium]